MERWQPNLEDENEPRAGLTINGNEILAHRGNTTLYKFMGGLAIYNHIYIEHPPSGFYIFNFAKGYDKVESFVQEHEYPQLLNITEVQDHDINAFNNAIEKTAGNIDTVPEDWL